MFNYFEIVRKKPFRSETDQLCFLKDYKILIEEYIISVVLSRNR